MTASYDIRLCICEDVVFQSFGDGHETVRFLRWARPEIIRAGLLCPLPGTALFDKPPPGVFQVRLRPLVE